MPITVKCADCDATREFPTNHEVFGDVEGLGNIDPTPYETFAVTDRAKTRWRKWADLYLCPDHAESHVEVYEAAMDQWSLDKATAAADFESRWIHNHPRPRP